MGLEPVVSPTQGRQLTGTRRPTLGVGGDVVAVAAVLVGPEPAGRAGAPGEHAGQVAQGDPFGDPVGDLVGVDVDVVERAGAREERARSVVREG